MPESFEVDSERSTANTSDVQPHSLARYVTLARFWEPTNTTHCHCCKPQPEQLAVRRGWITFESL